jgi:hypothetical protein
MRRGRHLFGDAWIAKGIAGESIRRSRRTIRRGRQTICHTHRVSRHAHRAKIHARQAILHGHEVAKQAHRMEKLAHSRAKHANKRAKPWRWWKKHAHSRRNAGHLARGVAHWLEKGWRRVDKVGAEISRRLKAKLKTDLVNCRFASICLVVGSAI